MKLCTTAALIAALVATACTPQGDGGDIGAPPPDDTFPQVPAPASAADPGTSPAAVEEEWTAGIVTSPGGAAPPVAVLEEARAAANQDFDRVVFQFAGDRLPGYHVEYVDRPVRQCGSGEPVPVAGDGWLLVRLEPAQAHDEQGRPTVEDRSQAPDLPVLQELKLICDFEAIVTWVLGVSSPNRYRVMELSDPARLVVDVRH